MVSVSFTNDEFITVVVNILDDNMFQLARDIATDAGLNLHSFKDLTIENQY